MHYSKIPSLCNSKFDPQNIGFTRITENEINVGNTKINDSDQYLFLNSSEMMINVHCSKPIIVEMINFDQNSRILFDDADYDADINTTFHHPDESTNLAFLYGGTRNSDVSSIPKVINNIRDYTSVGDDDCVHQANDGMDDDGKDNDDDATTGNDNDDGSGGGGGGGGGNNDAKDNDDDGMNKDDDKENDGMDDDGKNNDDGKDNDVVNVDEPLLILRFNKNGKFRDEIQTQIYANHYESWATFAAAVHQIYLAEYGHPPEDIVAEQHPALCWPGYFPTYERRDGENVTTMSWSALEWQAARTQINTVSVLDLDNSDIVTVMKYAFGPTPVDNQDGGDEGNNNGDCGNDGSEDGNRSNGGENNGDADSKRRRLS